MTIIIFGTPLLDSCSFLFFLEHVILCFRGVNDFGTHVKFDMLMRWGDSKRCNGTNCGRRRVEGRPSLRNRLWLCPPLSSFTWIEKLPTLYVLYKINAHLTLISCVLQGMLIRKKNLLQGTEIWHLRDRRFLKITK